MLFQNKDFQTILAPMSGKVIALSELEDPIFAGKVVGDGVAVIPSDGEVVAPVSGVISLVSEGQHSYGITSFDGTEILVHVGIDTVRLKGRGFTSLVKVGQRVDAGQLVCSADLELIRKEGFESTTPVVITSHSIDQISRLIMQTGFAVAGRTVCMKYIQQKK